ncbi:MAG: capsule assembly Wzi family protein [Gemmatimonadaceae bacterium]
MQSTVVALFAAQLISPIISSAQTSVGGRSEVFAGSELESYLRNLQTAGKSESYPWSIRSFSLAEVDRLASSDSAHPWGERYDLNRKPESTGFQWDYVRPRVSFYLNNTFAYGGNDGAVWQGKGLTTSFQAGLSARWGPFSAILAPVAFRAENQSFPLFRNGQSGRLIYADGQYPLALDRPQRYGTLPYSRFDLGQSTIRFDWFGVAAGISTANQWWGPTDTYPYILGNNAAGFPHFFVGTSQPANLWLARLHTRVVYGELEQSEYSSVRGTEYFRSFSEPGRRRFMAGIVASIQPRGARGLEIGGARFFHAARDSSGFGSHVLGMPFENLFKVQSSDDDPNDITNLRDNQLASIFIRWAPPGSGFDVYGEYGREDYAGDKRDLVLEPDHAGTVNIGFRKTWLSPRVMNVLRAEAFNFQSPAGARTREQGRIYLHGVLRQGHTNRGQLLGADVGPGSGGAQTLAFDRFTPEGRMTAFVSRMVTHQSTTQYRSGPVEPNAVEAMNSVGVEANRFFGSVDVMARIAIAVDLDRNFLADRTNANFVLGLRQSF